MSHMDRIEGKRDRYYVDHGGKASNAPDISELERYWNDPTYRARCDRETKHAQLLARQHWDHAQIQNGTRWPSHWTEEEKSDASQRLLDAYREDMAESNRRLRRGDFRKV